MPIETCPPWEYKHHPSASDLVPRSVQLVLQLRSKTIQAKDVIFDNRPPHKFLFTGLTPEHCPYFAGHWRGEDFRCLRYYNVGIDSDASVGVAAEFVAAELDIFVKNSFGVLNAVDTANELPLAILSEEVKLSYIVAFACSIFVEFLRIHPYANGNGHIARLITWALLARFGYWPKKWPLNKRPPDPPYSSLIKNYRLGQREALEIFVLKCILGEI